MLTNLPMLPTIMRRAHRLAPGSAARRMLGAGYTGPREAGYDEAAMNELRAMDPDTPFFMLNLLKVVDMEMYFK